MQVQHEQRRFGQATQCILAKAKNTKPWNA
jgi:hypothetical protein